MSTVSPSSITDTTPASSAAPSVDDGSISTTVATEEFTTTELPTFSAETYAPSTEIPTSPADTSAPSTEIPTSSAETCAPSVTTTANPAELENLFVGKLSNQIGDVLKHFQNPEPIGFPGHTVLNDPLAIPNTTTSLNGLLTGEFYNINVHGLSNFTVEAINTILDQMEVGTIFRYCEKKL